MKSQKRYWLLLIFTYFCLSQSANASNTINVQLYFGLSIPTGGYVSDQQWTHFLNHNIATAFSGFNVIDSTGYYKAQAEPAKIVTFILDDSDLKKVINLAETYAEKFQQDSVMMIKSPVLQWQFIEAKKSVLVE